MSLREEEGKRNKVLQEQRAKEHEQRLAKEKEVKEMKERAAAEAELKRSHEKSLADKHRRTPSCHQGLMEVMFSHHIDL